MLAFGDLSWVPFTYTLQARYLVLFPRVLALWEVIGIVGVYLAGMYIFRASNSQKDAFRTNPTDLSVAREFLSFLFFSFSFLQQTKTNQCNSTDLKTMGTKRGTKLIISGWWGTARHINYFGDWLMGLAYCLPCGFDSVIPYFFAIYFAILLIHRERRDDHACHKKYGADWKRYCDLVRWRIVPFLY